MHVDSLFRLAFREGCGLDFDCVRKSPQYKRYLAGELKKLSLYNEDYRANPQALMLQCGVYGVARLIRDHYDDADNQRPIYVRLAKRGPRKYHRDQALVRYLGDSLIRQAQQCLPDSLIALANKWQKSGTLERLNVLCNLGVLCSDLADECEGERPVDWLDNLNQPKDYRSCLPTYIGEFGSGGKANCLGIAMLLVAWAKRAGASVMWVNEMEFLLRRQSQHVHALSQRMLHVFEKEQCKVPKKRLRNLHERRDDTFLSMHMRRDFHHGVLIALDVGVWVYVDPYASVCAPVNTKWKLHPVILTMQEVEIVQPGVTAVVHDHGDLDNLYAKQQEFFEEACAVAVRLSALCRTAPDFSTLCARLEESPDTQWFIDNLIPHYVEVANVTKSGALLSHLFSADIHRKIDFSDWVDKKKFRRSFRPRCRSKIIEEALFLAMNRLVGEFQSRYHDGTLLPPSMEIAHPEFSVALLVMNQLRCQAPGNWHEINPEWFMELSSSQIHWYYATECGQMPQGNAMYPDAENLVRLALPHVHKSVQVRLSGLDKSREKDQVKV